MILIRFRGDRQAPARLSTSPPPDFQIPSDEPTLSDILENTRKQYFTTLYTAKVGTPARVMFWLEFLQ